MANYSKNRTDYVKNDDYYTPKSIFSCLNAKFDLDVCAPTGGVSWIPADNHYDIQIDGLKQNWFGFVWCNPPFSKPTPWIDKFIDHQNGIMLTQVSKSRAFIRLWNEAHAITFLPHTIKFEHIENGTKSIFMPVALFGMGDKARMHMKLSGINRLR